MWHTDLNAVFSVLFTIIMKVFAVGPTMRPCKQDDYHYQYTECDNDNHRWKVAIPNNTCVGNVPQPVRATDCNFSCKEGTYLDLRSQTCQECPSGTYSLGGGYIFEDFVSVPDEFSVTNERIGNQYYTESNSMFVDPSDNCDKSGWMAVNGYLIYVPSSCLSTLSYSVRLVRPGNVTFTYLYSDTDVSFAFSVQNAQCIVDNDRLSYLAYTTEGKWKTKSVALNKGQTLLTWKGWAVNGQSQPLLIKKIEIIGVAYAQQCTPCPNGTYSSANSKTCTPCLPGTYSTKGVSKCSDCDEKTTYSGFRATSCVKRPPCTQNDFVKVHSPCNEHGQASVSYKWVEPRTCSEDLPNAIKMSKDVTTVQCSPCNPGMEMVKSVCQFCQKDMFSDGHSACQKCPPNSSPNYGYQVSSWYTLPDVLQAECRQMEDYAQDCKNVTSWILAGDHFHTAYVRRHDIYFTLTLSVDGFQNLFLQGEPSDRNPIGSISFTFETKCAGPDCAFYFFKTDDPSMNGLADLDVIAQYNGTVNKTTFSHPITRKKNAQFMWMFVRGQLTQRKVDDEIWLKDQASIFNINVTNVKDVGASACIPCPVSDKKECAPCPPGHYLNEDDRKCILCPNGTYLNVSHTIGLDSCVTCGPNLMSEKGIECDTNCQFNISGKIYDLSPLRGIYQVKGVQIFNRDIRYHHLFNVSVCSKEKVTCSDSISIDSGRFGQDYNSVSSLACRIVAVPQESSTFFHGPLEIGDHIVGVSDVLKFPDFEIPRNIVAPWRFPELYFLYRSTTGRTSNCPNGRSTLILFRCDPGENKTHVDLPVSCPDSTCDGCLFQIIITSRIACPLCTKSDYSEVIGECNLGKQVIHYIPTKLCVLAGEDQLKTKTRKCQMLTFEVEVIIGVASFVALFLLLIVLYIWKKNQKLEYKYMKLVESSSGKDGELPAAESCGLHDDDDEDETSDRVVFAKGGKKTGWFSGRTNKMKNEGQGSENSALTLVGEIDDS